MEGLSGAEYLSAREAAEIVKEKSGIKINPRRITEAYTEGFAGQSPKKMGRPSRVPDAALEAMAIKCNLEQAAGNDLNPKQQQQIFEDMFRGTIHDTDQSGEKIDWSRSGSFQRSRAKRKQPHLLQPGKIKRVDLTRYQWAVYDTYEEWFAGWEAFLVERGYAAWNDIFNSSGALVSNIEFLPGKLGRILNGDETDMPRDASKRPKGGSTGACCINPLLPRPGRPATQTSGHETLFLFVTASGEVCPVILICDSDCEDPNQQRVELELVVGLPSVVGRFGCEQAKQFEPIIACSKKGGTTTVLWRSILGHLIGLYPDVSPLNPICLKVGGGPGRLDRETLLWCVEVGIDVFPGFPNGSGYNQELDEMYDSFKKLLYSEGDALEAERREAVRKADDEDARRAAEKNVALKRTDIPRILMGKDEDGASGPLAVAFSEEKVLDAWATIGAAVVMEGTDGVCTRASLSNPLLRKEASNSGEVRKSIGRLEELNRELESKGFNKLAVPADLTAGKGTKEKSEARKAASSRFRIDEGQKEKAAISVALMGRLTTGGVFARIGARALTSGPVVGGLAVKEAAKINAEARASEKAKAGDLKRKKKALEALEEQRKKHADEGDWGDVKTWTQGRLKAVTGYIAKKGEQTADQNKGSEWMLQNFLSVRSSMDWVPLTEADLKAIADSEGSPIQDGGMEAHAGAAFGLGAMPLQTAEDKRRAITAAYEKAKADAEAKFKLQLAALDLDPGA